MPIDPREMFKPRPAEEAAAPLGGSRAERVQRLQVGATGIVAMVLMVALADIVISRARETEATLVPEAAASVVAGEAEAPRDPLADAGVVPDLPADPAATATPGTSDAAPPQP